MLRKSFNYTASLFAGTGIYSVIYIFLLSLSPLAYCQQSGCSCKGGSCSSQTIGSTGPIVFDFEGGNPQGWLVAEGKFGKFISDRKFFHNTPTVPYNKHGEYYLSTLETPDGKVDDSYRGVIISPLFVLSSTKMSFLIGGGGHNDTYVALCRDNGKELLKAHGKNAEKMTMVSWDVTKYKGQRLFLKIVDDNTGPWGHITFDDFQSYGSVLKQTAGIRLANYHKNNRLLEQQRIEKQKQQQSQRRKRLQQLLNDKTLFAPGEKYTYAGEHLGAIDIPIGGIAAGDIQMDGKGRRNIWQIFNNYQAIDLPDSFFAIRVATKQGDKRVIRALQTVPVGAFPAMEKLTFNGEYPFAWYNFQDRDLPVQVQMRVFNPLIPLDTKNSSIPCAIFNISVMNNNEQAVVVSLLAAQQNAVGLSGTKTIQHTKSLDYGGNINTVIQKGNTTKLHMTSNNSAAGDMTLIALPAVINNKPAAGENFNSITYQARWDNTEQLYTSFAKNGKLAGNSQAGPSATNETINGALADTVIIKPGKKITVTFILTWYFPQGRDGQGKWGATGNYYCNLWSNALDVADYLVANINRLSNQTMLYHDSLYQSNLPHWLLDRISSQIVVLRSKTCFWNKNGYFGGWEGCCPGNGCCYGNCNHVWQYAQEHARLFPEIARIMRDESFGYERKDGSLPMRHPDGGTAFDGQCGEILSAYREYLCSTNRKWLDKIWPRVEKAMNFTIKHWDNDEDGVLAGPQHNTLDAELTGSSSWLGSLYLAALQASAKMADIEHKPQLAKHYRKIWATGAKKQNETLWNGQYYYQLTGNKPRRDYGNGCAIDQVLGEWWARQVNVQTAYPDRRVKKALQSLFKYNFKADFHGIKQVPRKFVDDNDAGMQMITWPLGKRPKNHTLYADEVMSGFEYSAAATMIQYGLLRDAFVVLKAAHDRYDGRLRTGLDSRPTASWGYSGNPFGDDECGKFYARPMSIWSVLLACQGFIYDGPAGIIGFAPIWRPQNHRSFFTGAQGWGVFTQHRSPKRNPYQQSETIEVRYGSLKVNELIFALPRTKVDTKTHTNSNTRTHITDAIRNRKEISANGTVVSIKEISVMAGNKKLKFNAGVNNFQLHIKLTQPIIITRTNPMHIKIRLIHHATFHSF